ncbi:hypothetical protein ACPCG0_02400 [Propionibacteriaceae bacterium Y1923]
MTDRGPEEDMNKRATRSGVQGYSADTDDWLHDIDHDEQRIDPNREVGGRGRSGGGSPMMMPPMGMGGAGGAAGAGAAGGLGGGLGAGGMGGFGAGARAGTFAGGGMPGTTPAGAGISGGGPGGIGAPGGGGIGGAGLGGGGLGAGGIGGGTFAAGSGGGLDGVDTDGDGIPDTFSNGGIDTDGDGIPDKWPGGGIDTDGDGIPDTWPGSTTNPGTGGSGPKDPFGGAQTGGPGDIDVDTTELDTGAKEWATMSDRMSAVLARANARATTTEEFGFVTGPNGQYNEMTSAITAWSTSASAEFGVISDNLVADARAYRQTEQLNASQTSAITQEMQ